MLISLSKALNHRCVYHIFYETLTILQHHGPLVGANLYRLEPEVRVCEQLTQSRTRDSEHDILAVRHRVIVFIKWVRRPQNAFKHCKQLYTFGYRAIISRKIRKPSSVTGICRQRSANNNVSRRLRPPRTAGTQCVVLRTKVYQCLR